MVQLLLLYKTVLRRSLIMYLHVQLPYISINDDDFASFSFTAGFVALNNNIAVHWAT